MSKWYVDPADRQRHIYISGKTRYGKTNLMQAMVYQDMRAGHGLCVIDGKGNSPEPLSLQLLDWVPRSRKKDVTYLDIDDPIPIDFMSCMDEGEAAARAADMGEMFNRLDSSIGRRMDAILQWIIVSLNLIGKPALLDIYDVLVDPSVREKIRAHPAICNHPQLSHFWGKPKDDKKKNNRKRSDNELPLSEKMIKGESGIALAITQMTKFVLSPPLVTVLGKAEHPLNIEDAIANNRILIVRLNAGDPASIIYGSLLTSKIQQAIFHRKPREAHSPFMLYVDEFQDYKPAAFDRTLSQGGGLGLYLTVANQYFNQLDDSTRSAIEGTVSTFFFFNQSTSNVARLSDLIPGPIPPPDTTPQKIRDIKEDLKEVVSLRKYWLRELEYADSDGIAHAAANRLENVESQEQKLRDRLSKLQIPKPKPKTYLDLLPDLQVGEAIYRAANGNVTKIKAPAPPPPRHAVGKTSWAEYIKAETLKEYGPKDNPTDAQSGQNRTTPVSTGQTPSVSQNDRDEHLHPKDEEIAPSGPATIQTDPPTD